MTVLVGLGLLALLWAIVVVAAEGYHNLLDEVALHLHRAAVRGRARHARQAAVLAAQWRQHQPRTEEPPSPLSPEEIEQIGVSGWR